jgi:hypothetical protein
VHLIGFYYKKEYELFGSWYGPDSGHKRYQSSFSGIKGVEYPEGMGDSEDMNIKNSERRIFAWAFDCQCSGGVYCPLSFFISCLMLKMKALPAIEMLATSHLMT